MIGVLSLLMLGGSPDYDAAVQAATTDTRFLSPWVATLPDHAELPDPREHLGYIAGAPGKVTDVDEIHAYFRKLAQRSPRALLTSFGLSDDGREGLVLAIADESTVAAMDRYRDDLAALADPRKTDAQTAATLIAEAKPIYWITAGLHSAELGSPEMVMELAYRLLVEEREPFRSIRKNLIVLITPVLEVDGRARQVAWTRNYGLNPRSERDHPPFSAPYWGRYVHHDNNRDAIVASQRLTRNYLNTYFYWRPTLTLDLHESIPYLYVSGGTGPYNEGFDATTITEWQGLAQREMTRLIGFGMPGVWTWGYYDGWSPSFMLAIANTHNALGRFFETFGNGTPATLVRDISERSIANRPTISRQWYRPVPPEASTRWSMRNNTNYMQSGVIASLEAVASDPRTFLRNFYERGVRAVEAGRTVSPHAFVIPRSQRDRGATAELIEVLHRQRIELHVAQEELVTPERKILAGDVLVRLDQPYGRLARNLLEIQRYPQKVDVASTDDVAWTLGLLMGVSVFPVAEPRVLAVAATLLANDVDLFTAPKQPRAKVWAIAHQAQRNLGPFRFALGDVPVFSASAAFTAEGRAFPPGTLLIETHSVRGIDVPAVMSRFSLEGFALQTMPQVARHVLDLPRIAVLHDWAYTQNTGWLRFTLDQAGLSYTLADPERLKRSRMRREFDVIVAPAHRANATAADYIRGVDTRWGPLRFDPSPQPPGRFIPATRDLTGGLGFDGMRALQRFVEEGGVLITLGSAGVLATESGLARQIGSERPAGMNTPGSVTTARVVARQSPLAYGYEKLTHVFHGNGPVFTVPTAHECAVVIRFGANDGTAPLIQSGGIVSPEAQLNDRPALMVEPMGTGRLVVFGWNPLHRHLNHHDHAWFYNALMYWNDLTNCGALQS